MKKNRKVKLITILIIAISIFTIFISRNKIKEVFNKVRESLASSSTVFKMNDYIYYDPVNNKACSQNSYWTPYYTNTTCYRFVVVDINDTSSKSTIRAMLDHDIGTGTF